MPELGDGIIRCVRSHAACLKADGFGGGVCKVRHGANVAQRITVSDALKIGGAGNLCSLGGIDNQAFRLHDRFRNELIVDQAFDGRAVVLDGHVQSVLGIEIKIVANKLGKAVLDVCVDGTFGEGEPQAAVNVKVVGASDAAAEHDGTHVVLVSSVGDKGLGGVGFFERMRKSHAVPALIGQRKAALVHRIVLVRGKDQRVVAFQLAVRVVCKIEMKVGAQIHSRERSRKTDVLVVWHLNIQRRLGLCLGFRDRLGRGFCVTCLGSSRAEGVGRVLGAARIAGNQGQKHQHSQYAAEYFCFHACVRSKALSNLLID